MTEPIEAEIVPKLPKSREPPEFLKKAMDSLAGGLIPPEALEALQDAQDSSDKFQRRVLEGLGDIWTKVEALRVQVDRVEQKLNIVASQQK